MSSMVKTVCLATMIFLLSACATPGKLVLLQNADALASNKTVYPDRATIYVVGDYISDGFVRVIMDGDTAGNLSKRSFIRLAATGGEHVIRIEYFDRTGIFELKAIFVAGKTYYLKFDAAHGLPARGVMWESHFRIEQVDEARVQPIIAAGAQQ